MQPMSSEPEQVADYLAGETEAIAEYRHELWRLDNWRKAPEAGEVPFFDERITVKDDRNGRPAACLGQSSPRRGGAIRRRISREILNDRAARPMARPLPPMDNRRHQ